MTDDKVKRQIYNLHAEVCKTLADPKRLMILDELRRGERSVGELATALGLRQANVSQHLAVMRERGIVVSRRKGTGIYYSLANPKITQACDILREILLEQLQEGKALAQAIADQP